MKPVFVRKVKFSRLAHVPCCYGNGCLLAGKQNENDRGGKAKSHGVDAKSTKKGASKRCVLMRLGI